MADHIPSRAVQLLYIQHRILLVIFKAWPFLAAKCSNSPPDWKRLCNHLQGLGKIPSYIATVAESTESTSTDVGKLSSDDRPLRKLSMGRAGFGRDTHYAIWAFSRD